MNVLYMALERSKRALHFSFDDQLYAIRRNLMIASSVVIGSTFLSPPKDGVYEVNIGVIKGVVEKPEYISYFLALVCTYYLLWFYVQCRKVAVDNYQNIKTTFMGHVAALRADAAYQSLGIGGVGSPAFRVNHTTNGVMKAGISFPESSVKDYAFSVEKFKGTEFNIGRKNGSIFIDYPYAAVLEDFKYLNIHLDHYWRGRVSYLFTTALPIAYASFAIALLGVHIHSQLTSA